MKTLPYEFMQVQKRVLGWLCVLLAPCCLLFGLLALDSNLPGWYESISATYYANSNSLMMGLLVATSVFFFTHSGYDLHDRIVSFIEAVSCLGVVFFPCATPGAPESVGLFGLSPDASHTPHCVSAGVLFVAFAYNILFRFTKHKGGMSDKKRARNLRYYICGSLILAGILSQSLYSVGVYSVPDWFPMTWFNEFVMLTAFGVAYLVKSGMFPRLND